MLKAVRIPKAKAPSQGIPGNASKRSSEERLELRLEK